jgi:hypothetical protein
VSVGLPDLRRISLDFGYLALGHPVFVIYTIMNSFSDLLLLLLLILLLLLAVREARVWGETSTPF